MTEVKHCHLQCNLNEQNEKFKKEKRQKYLKRSQKQRIQKSLKVKFSLKTNIEELLL